MYCETYSKFGWYHGSSNPFRPVEHVLIAYGMKGVFFIFKCQNGSKFREEDDNECSKSNQSTSKEELIEKLDEAGPDYRF